MGREDPRAWLKQGGRGARAGGAAAAAAAASVPPSTALADSASEKLKQRESPAPRPSPPTPTSRPSYPFPSQGARACTRVKGLRPGWGLGRRWSGAAAVHERGWGGGWGGRWSGERPGSCQPYAPCARAWGVVCIQVGEEC